MGTGTFSNGFSAVVQPLVDEFGWSRTAISGAVSLSRLEGGSAAPVMGWLVDRFGPRRMAFAGVAIFGTGLVLLSQINSLFGRYACFLIASIGRAIY